MENNELTRRDFARAAVAAVAVPMLAPLAGCTPSAPSQAPAPAPTAAPDSAAPAPATGQQEPPSPLALALAQAIRVQYGDRMTDQQMAAVTRGISGNLNTAARLRAYEIPIAAEPAFVYRVYGGPAR